MGQTRVDLLHLLEDLRDAYPGALEETILTEIVANSLDSGASRVSLWADAAASTLVAVDDGSGMVRAELRKYHDIAATGKKRGQGIGFAGVGIKLGLLISDEVVTETRRGATHVATSWGLASRHKAPWNWIAPPGMVAERGTAVRLRLKNPLSPLLDPGFVIATIQRNFQPMLERHFDDVLAATYRAGVRFLVNGEELRRNDLGMSRIPFQIRLGRKRKPSAVGYLERRSGPMAEDRRGVAISTLGKVIKRGWDWIGVPCTAPEQIGGLVEVPALAECLTLNKADFIRTGSRGMTYLAYRKALQEAVAAQLGAWGDAVDRFEQARRRRTRPLERDLEDVLADLANDFPLVASLVERRAGGQRKLPMGDRSEQHAEVAAALATLAAAVDPPDDGGHEGADAGPRESEATTAGDTSASPPETASAPPEAPASVQLPASASGRKKAARYGLAIQFESRPEALELGRLAESTVWVNEAHPAYRRAAVSRSEGYHVALTVAMALAPLAVEPHLEREFVVTFLARWGEAIDRGAAVAKARKTRGGSRRQRELPLDGDTARSVGDSVGSS